MAAGRRGEGGTGHRPAGGGEPMQEKLGGRITPANAIYVRTIPRPSDGGRCLSSGTLWRQGAGGRESVGVAPQKHGGGPCMSGRGKGARTTKRGAGEGRVASLPRPRRHRGIMPIVFTTCVARRTVWHAPTSARAAARHEAARADGHDLRSLDGPSGTGPVELLSTPPPHCRLGPHPPPPRGGGGSDVGANQM